jgi:hypothetical protein
MSEFEIELVLTDRSSVIGNANDEASALNLMAEAVRQYPRSHIRVRRNAEIIAERVPPRKPKMTVRCPALARRKARKD